MYVALLETIKEGLRTVAFSLIELSLKFNTKLWLLWMCFMIIYRITISGGAVCKFHNFFRIDINIDLVAWKDLSEINVNKQKKLLKHNRN